MTKTHSNPKDRISTQLKISLVVPEIRVADVSFNQNQILSALNKLINSDKLPHLILFPELCLTGVTCGDLFFQPLLWEKALQALRQITQSIAGKNLYLLLGLPLALSKGLFNAVALIGPDGIDRFVVNEKPQARWFLPAEKLPDDEKIQIDASWVSVERSKVIHLNQLNLQIQVGKLAEPIPGIDLLLNPCALPACAELDCEVNGADYSSRYSLVLASCSSGPGESTTDQVFCGQASVWQSGHLLAQTQPLRFETRTVSSLLDFSAGDLTPETSPLPNSKNAFEAPYIRKDSPELQFAKIFDIQAAGLMSRLRHTHTKKLVLGISGGADSSLALLVCCRAMDLLGFPRSDILAVSMPGPGSTQDSQARIQTLTELAAVNSLTIPIHTALKTHLQDIYHPGNLFDTTYENAQARERTQILMDLANQQRALVVGTGDLSEIALGWSTFNGDHMSMYNVNAGLPKTLLLRVLVWAGEFLFSTQGRQITEKIAQAPITPELLPLDQTGAQNQDTQKTLGPYLLHDFFLYHLIKNHLSPQKIFDLACEVFQQKYQPDFILQCLKTFYSRFFSQQFKRSASPDGPQVLSYSLSPRSAWLMPSDASAALWMEELNLIQNTLKEINRGT